MRLYGAAKWTPRTVLLRSGCLPRRPLVSVFTVKQWTRGVTQKMGLSAGRAWLARTSPPKKPNDFQITINICSTTDASRRRCSIHGFPSQAFPLRTKAPKVTACEELWFPIMRRVWGYTGPPKRGPYHWEVNSKSYQRTMPDYAAPSLCGKRTMWESWIGGSGHVHNGKREGRSTLLMLTRVG